ncbi:uncharacterized protein LOC124148161 [Haliotis rufescens]|uniref:uncharacterized protein LOC124148161 n=1 Tax=Haliotis rufescens TaxID=6454 RepID=UPI001EAFE976|nr:uncharacterized protein LOC124148161 [Haliotis rufescens]
MDTLNLGLLIVVFVSGAAGYTSCKKTYWDYWRWEYRQSTYYCTGYCCGTSYDDKCCSYDSSIISSFTYTKTWVIVGGVLGGLFGLFVVCMIIGAVMYAFFKTTQHGSRSRTVHPSSNTNTQTISYGPGLAQPPPYTTAAPPPPEYSPPLGGYNETGPIDKRGHNPYPGPQPLQVQPFPGGAAGPSGSEPAEAIAGAPPRSTFA